MSAAVAPPPSPSAKSLPCQGDPDRWFDRRQRRDTLAQCLSCPARAWCAEQALTWQACWGMWAGVWIDGQHSDAEPYLHAIATDRPSERLAPRQLRTAPPIVAPQHGATSPVPLYRPPAAGRPSSTAAIVLARSCGHCEVLTEQCRYTFDRLVSRHSHSGPTESLSPAGLFAACGGCAELVASMQPQLAARAGYVVDTARDPATVPMRWRGTRWVLLGHDGWLTELRQDAQSA